MLANKLFRTTVPVSSLRNRGAPTTHNAGQEGHPNFATKTRRRQSLGPNNNATRTQRSKEGERGQTSATRCYRNEPSSSENARSSRQNRGESRGEAPKSETPSYIVFSRALCAGRLRAGLRSEITPQTKGEKKKPHKKQAGFPNANQH